MNATSEWPVVCIKDVCESVIDCVNKTAPTVTYSTPYKMIRTTNVKDGWIDLDDVRFVEADVFARWNRRTTPRKGDVILTREAPLGEVGMLRSNDQVFLGQRLVLYRADPLKLDNHFLLYSFRFDYLQGQIKSLGSGATVEHMRVPDAEKLLLRLPSLPIQRRVGGILSAYDDLIENNTRRIKLLEEMAQMIYREWFVNFRFPGHQMVKLVESDNGAIPEGWSLETIGEAVEVVGGGTPSTDMPEYWESGEIVWYSPSDLTAAGSMFMFTSDKKITDLGLKKSSARLFPANSVMMTSRATIGVVSINATPACTNQGFITCIPSGRVSQYLIYFWVLENKTKITSLASGATFKEINKRTFRELPILIPAAGILSLFMECVSPVCELVRNLLQRNTNLRQTRDLLLPKLISGEVSVEQVEAGAVAQVV